MKKHSKRFISLALSVAMVIGSFGITNTFAANRQERTLTVRPGIAEATEYDNMLLNEELASRYLETNSNDVQSSLLGSLTPEQVNYVNDYAKSIDTKLGLIGFDEDFDFSSEEQVSVIVELNTLPSAILPVYTALNGGVMSEAAAERSVFASQSDFSAQAANAGIAAEIDIIKTYSKLFNGFSVTLPANTVKELVALKSVFSVSPDFTVCLDPEEDASTPVGADDYSDFKGLGMAESRELFNMNYINDTLGLDGEGMLVGVIDTGVDYNNPDLINGFVGGYDYVDNDDDPMETTYEDYLKVKDSMPWINPDSGTVYITSHGTHVAGTIAGRGENTESAYSTLGIAPKAKFKMYRVLGPYGTGTTSNILAAIEQSYNDGCDVVNMSLGMSANLPYYATVTMVNNAVIGGTVFAVAAGNSGFDQYSGRVVMGSLGCPGTAYLAITSGAGTAGGADVFSYEEAEFTGASEAVEVRSVGGDFDNRFENDIITNTTLNYIEEKGYEFVMVPGVGNVSDYAGLPSLNGKVAVVYRGSINFTEKLANAISHGAGAMLLINNLDEFLTNISISNELKDSIPVLCVTDKAGEIIKAGYQATVSAGNPAYIKLNSVNTVHAENLLASFSSRGPVAQLIGIKPDIVAPGFDVMSTQPAFAVNPNYEDSDYTYAYARKSGTSMASPHIAGIAVLMRQKFPDATPAEIKARMMNTAYPLDDNYSVFEVGAGFVDPIRALTEASYFTVQDHIPMQTLEQITGTSGYLLEDQTLSSLNFGITKRNEEGDTLSRPLTVKIHNTSNESKEYFFSYEVNDGVEYSLPSSEHGVYVIADAASITVAAGQTGEVIINAVIPQAAPKGTYEGNIFFTADSDVYTMPYAVVADHPLEPSHFDAEASFVTRPIVTNAKVGSYDPAFNAFAQFGNVVSVWVGGIMSKVEVYACDYETNEILGLLASYDTSSANPRTYITLGNAISGTVRELEDGKPTGGLRDLEDGIYGVILAGYIGSEDEAILSDTVRVGSYVIDSEFPTLTIYTLGNVQSVSNNPDALIYEYPAGATSINIKGNIFSKGAALLEQYGITYDLYEERPVIDQSFNAAIFPKLGNTAEAIAYCDKNGDFNLTIPVFLPGSQYSYMVGGLRNVSVYGLDYKFNQLIWQGNTHVIKGIGYVKGATFDSLTAVNGNMTMSLSGTPYYTPSLKNIKATVKVEGIDTPITINSCTYNGTTKKVTMLYDLLPRTYEVQNATATVEYAQQTKTVNFTIPALPKTKITTVGIAVTAPAVYEVPQATITEGVGYTGEISWTPSPDTFDFSTVYSANITLTAKYGYEFDSAVVPTVAGATITNVVNTGSELTFTATFPATRAQSKISSLKINSSALTSMKKGQTLQLSYTILPNTESVNGEITWKSSNPAIATVSNTGLVTALGTGTIVITLTVPTIYGNVTTSISVKISN